MWLMNLLFGKGPETAPKQEDQKKVESLQLNEVTDTTAHADVQHIVNIIWKNLNKESSEAVVKSLWHNTAMNADIYELDFTNNSHTCAVTFNDRVGDDDFTVKWDMDGNEDTPDDIYEFKIDYLEDTPESGIQKFIVERWHPSELGNLHFSIVEQDEINRVIGFMKNCLNISSESPTTIDARPETLEPLNIAA